MAAYCNFDSLNVLLKASSKDIVIRLCNEAAVHSGTRFSATITTTAADCLSVDKRNAQQVLQSLKSLLQAAIFQGYTSPTELQTLFPGNFHKNLRDLLIKIIVDNINSWKTYAINNQVSLPRLVDFDWRVDVKTASDAISRMSVPTCILQMQVQENSDKVGQTADISNVNVELSKETLDTMLDGLSKIRDQLSSVAKR
ncbi:COMMD9 [Mytilus coruscus]|uniref:COMMD9 n=1 Tax=Mytilus coruscus TaxID=42192 RepID=A0A6J8BW96_MYTCO|nr:COMMD9 [Mytilus coruscus]